MRTHGEANLEVAVEMGKRFDISWLVFIDKESKNEIMFFHEDSKLLNDHHYKRNRHNAGYEGDSRDTGSIGALVSVVAGHDRDKGHCRKRSDHDEALDDLLSEKTHHLQRKAESYGNEDHLECHAHIDVGSLQDFHAVGEADERA